MDKNEKLIFLQAAIVRASIEAQACTAENMQRAQLGQSMAYNDHDFIRIIDQQGIGINDIALFLARED
jgi:hypothetical protein